MIRGFFAMGIAIAALSGCLVDLYGGDPRLQLKNTSAFPVKTVGVGDPDNPTWTHDLEPVLKTGKTSEVIDLPVAGDLNLWILVSDTAAGLDTVLLRPQRFDLGGFRLLEVKGQDRSELSTTP
ncbi:MAG TPA: hypothetical protein PK208_03130 [Fibrobacteria bacterium]|nr:hypothetical protein [Fibrobacteria bacterium]